MSSSGETEQIRVRVQVAGQGRSNIDTGLPVLDRLLMLLAEYSGFDVVVGLAPGDTARGAVAVARALGEALAPQLRTPTVDGYGSAVLPVDEALAQVVLEVSERPVLASNVDLSQARLGGLGSDLVTDFLHRFAEGAGITLHVRLIAGDDAQHVLEAMFKALGVALARACRPAKGVAMDKEAIRTEAAPAPFQGAPYSQAIKAGGLLFVSGQVALQPGAAKPVSDTIGEQTDQVFANLRAILEAAGSSLDRIVKTTVYLTDLGDFQAMNDVYKQYVGELPPARATIEVSKLPAGSLVEIEAIALA